jgi:Putative prokaryotic signal transducing protein
MTPTRESLLERFQLLSDEELLALFQSGDLIDTAREVAAAELWQRGVDLAKPAADAQAPSEDTFASADEGTLVSGDLMLIARVFTPIEAHMLQSRLEAEGVPAVVADAHIVQANPFLTMAVGGVRVLVPESHAEQAREIMRAIERGDYALDEQKHR